MPAKSKNNEAIWDKLVQQDVLCSQPRLDMDSQKAREYLTHTRFYGEELKGKKVLCLACGGGQQSIAFALLGAEVTVVDFSAEQLKKEELVAQAFKKDIRTIKTDMRDLSMLDTASFDIVFQPYSINYIPSIEQVLDEVARVIKPMGIYDLMFHNPYVHGSWKDGSWGSEWQPNELWEGKGYPLWQPYKDGQPIETKDPHWNFTNQDDEAVKIESPQEYRHTLSTIMNGLLSRRFELLHLKEEAGNEWDAPPGSWEHYQSVAPPWLWLVSSKKEA